MSSDSTLNEKIINAVRENELLYNKFSKNYKNIARKGEIWKKISNALGISETECITRWKSLRDKYKREKNLKETKPSGSAVISKPEWCLYKKMNFLSDFVKPRETTGNCTEIVGEEEEPIFCEIDVFDFKEKSTPPEVTEILEDHSSTSTSYTPSTPKKRKDTSIEEHLLGTITALKTFIEKKAEDSNVSSNQDFLKRVDVLLSGLRTTNRGIAEKEIIEYLCKCQIIDLNDGSVANMN